MAKNPLGTQFTVTEVAEYTLHNGVDCWIVKFLNEKGGKIPYTFPKFTLEQRVAEYDLDPTDITGVLDMILHEPHVPDSTDVRNFATDAGVKAGFTVAAAKSKGMVRAGQLVPLHLGNAPDRATARQAHLARIADIKTTITVKSGKGAGILSKGDTTDPLTTIVANHGVDPTRVASRAAYVQAIMTGSTAPRMVMSSPGAVPVAPTTMPTPIYDPAVRRRGLTVTLLDT